MGDHRSPTIFAPVFEHLAQLPISKRNREFAQYLWGLSWDFVFWPSEMDCDSALERLGLARPGSGPDPDTQYWDPNRGQWRE